MSNLPTDPVAWVPVHPRTGPLWANTITSIDADRPSYPLMPLYGSPPEPSPSEALEWTCMHGHPLTPAALLKIRKMQQPHEPSGCSECARLQAQLDAANLYIDADTRRSLQQALEPDGWQPFETAPEGGPDILLAIADGTIRMGQWLDNSDTPHPWKGWRYGGVIRPGQHHPTHWRPLPSFPETKGADHG